MSIIGVQDVTTYMGGNTLTPAQEVMVGEIIIPGIQDQLEKYLNTMVELVQVRESLCPEQDGYIYFTYAPVRKLLSVIWSQSGAQPVSVTQYVPDPIIADPSITRPVIDRTATSTIPDSYRYYVGQMGLPGLYSGSNPPYLVVDYIAGYDGVQDSALKLAMLRVIAREIEHQFDTSSGLRNGSIEAVADSDTRVKGWTPDELHALDRLRRLVIV